MFAYVGLRTACFDTPLGVMRLLVDAQGALLRLDFEEETVHGLTPEQLAGLIPEPALAEPVQEQLDAYFAGKRQQFDLPFSLQGTEFQQQVWQALLTIPYGQTWTYGQMAEHLDRPKAVRAVGQACGLNPISIIVPCHRVQGANGMLTGFSSGLLRKASLLDFERRVYLTGEADFQLSMPAQLDLF
ncbi:methylated-DNA--[protein]-cysteine S-methyltransferase [Alcaligenes aquatilis]|uniref:methylated-DNA--[protein]-cysteine S-methyltransferase n=1 Tax=Alcaligenes aquatilis TaxID=323284 RepID=UPI000F66D2C0|nr:methylated-DNA--[protein]-cysteine S-methyltransferase [Alcaligenes aquatilis]QXR36275.1 methylated-DNA--[protein]-cysteine S-methyltransferase [Alcaligenes aquatilis]